VRERAGRADPLRSPTLDVACLPIQHVDRRRGRSSIGVRPTEDAWPRIAASAALPLGGPVWFRACRDANDGVGGDSPARYHMDRHEIRVRTRRGGYHADQIRGPLNMVRFGMLTQRAIAPVLSELPANPQTPNVTWRLMPFLFYRLM